MFDTCFSVLHLTVIVKAKKITRENKVFMKFYTNAHIKVILTVE